jgi:sec-independent protein translocase protein TatB
MPSIGPLEIVLVAVVALIVFGPEKLPELARTVGRTAQQLRRAASDLRDEFDSALDPRDEDETPPAGRARRRPRAESADGATAEEGERAAPEATGLDDAGSAEPDDESDAPGAASDPVADDPRPRAPGGS